MRFTLLLLAGFALALMAGEAEADDLGTPMLTGGENWTEVADEPAEVGDGALSVNWDKTDVVMRGTVVVVSGASAGDTTSISIVSQAEGYSPSYIETEVGSLGATFKWKNNDNISHSVTADNSEFDSGIIAPGDSWEYIFDSVGTYTYYCGIHAATEQARTNYIPLWTADSYLLFWANFSMNASSINVIVQEKGYDLDSPQAVKLTENNGFSIVSVNGTVMGDFLKGNTDNEWKKYQIYLNSEKLGYHALNYDPHEDNAYSFVFSIRGIKGSAAIGGLQLIRTLDTGFFLTKDDPGQLTYEIFPSLAVEIDYFAKNIGTEDNTFRMTPELDAQGKAYAGAAFDISINVRMNGETFDSIITTSNDDGTWTHEFDLGSDDEAVITIHITAPDYDQDSGEPAGNRKFDVVLNAYDVGSGEDMREPVTATLFIKPSQFVLGDVSFNRLAVLEGDSLEITAKVWNEGNYASDVLVVFYILNETGSMYATPDGNMRLTRVASTTVDLMAPKPVLEDAGIYQTWYYATATWDEAFVSDGATQSYEEVEIYVQINPQLEQQDIDAGETQKDEYLRLREDNGAFGNIMVVERLIESVNCYVDTYPISLQSFIFLPYSEPNGPCSEDQVISFSLIAGEDGSGVWTVQIIKSSPQASVFSAHWYLMDVQGNTKTDGLVSDVYGYYSGQGKAVVFIDNDFNGKLSPGDKFEIHPGEADSALSSVSDVSDYSLKIRIYAEGEPQEEDSNNGGYAPCVDGDTKTAEDGCNQCVCNNGEWVCTEVDCNPEGGNPDDSDVELQVDDGFLPAPSLAVAVAAVAVMALRRRP